MDHSKKSKHLVKTIITETLLFIQVPYCLVVSEEKIRQRWIPEDGNNHKYLAIFL